jgi:NodT family efflux transporter outer membrane factor (OMF) lipoprotein
MLKTQDWNQQMEVPVLKQAIWVAGMVVTGLFTGCAAVNTDFSRPAQPSAQGYAPGQLPLTTASTEGPGGAAQQFVPERDIRADWWTLFQSPQLNTFIAAALAANPAVESAQAALRAAQAGVLAQQGAYFPTVQASYAPSRTRMASDGVPASLNGSTASVFTLHTAQVTVGFVPDVFGGNRWQVASLKAQADYQRFQLEATYVTLAANIVAAAIQDAALHRQIALAQEVITGNMTTLELVRRQYKAGYVSHLDVAVQESAFAQAQQQLPTLQKQLEINRDALRMLAGLAQDAQVPAFSLDELQLPSELPLTVPSQLVVQRPDVRAAEEQLHAACAQVGIARANRLPQFSIGATLGASATQLNQLFWNSGRFLELTGSVTQPLFDAGTLKHREQATVETLRQATAQYQATANVAFQNVADALHALYADADAMKAASQTAAAAKTALELMQRQHARGYLDRVTLVGAEQAYRQARMGVVQAQANRLADTVALLQALGGGWWHRQDAS